MNERAPSEKNQVRMRAASCLDTFVSETEHTAMINRAVGDEVSIIYAAVLGLAAAAVRVKIAELRYLATGVEDVP